MQQNDNKTPKIRRDLYVLFTFAVFIMAAISASHYLLFSTDSSKAQASHCDIGLQACEVNIAGDKYVARLAQPVVVEKWLTLDIDIPSGHIIDGIWIEGINMYMGRLPVVKEQGAYTTYLGACSEPDMKWKLTAVVTTPEGQRTLEYKFTTTMR